jgi:hypothetical protein
VTFGAGLGNPWPVIGSPADADAADGDEAVASASPPGPLLLQAARSNVTQVPTAADASRDVDMGPPRR